MHPANKGDVRQLMKEIREKYPDKTIWLYTGDVWEHLYRDSLMQYVDVLVDGEFEIAKRDVKLMWKGSSNQRVVDVQASLKQENPAVPVLHSPDYPCTEDTLQMTADGQKERRSGCGE